MGEDPPLPHGRPTALPQAEAEEPAGAEQHSPLSNRDFPPMERPTPQGLPVVGNGFDLNTYREAHTTGVTPLPDGLLSRTGGFWVISIGIPQSHPMVRSQRC